MIVEDCFFDPVKDLTPVDQFGFIDLKAAFDTSTVPTRMPESETDYNGIDDPSKVLGKPHDVFEAIDAQNAVVAASSALGDEDGNDS